MTVKSFDQWVVLSWSASQEAFHRETVEEMIHHNWDSFLHRENPHSDWIVLAIAPNDESIEAVRQMLLRKLDEPDRDAPDIPPEEQL
jgi:hypothetical protein